MDEIEEQDSVQVHNVVSTGNREIDQKMGGGIPVGSLTLMEGESGAGKSVLANQLTWGALREGRRVVLYTTENTFPSFVRHMISLNLDVTDYLLMGRLKLYPMPLSKPDWPVRRVLQAVEESMRRLPADFFVVDSLTGLGAHALLRETDESSLIGFFEKLREVCEQGKTVVTVVHSYAFDERMLIRLRSLCDADLRLRIEEVGDQLVKVLEVAKVRGAEKKTGNIVAFDVEPGIGMRIIPVSKAKA